MDKAQRDTLRNVVEQCRTILEESLRYMMEGHFGIDENGRIEAEDKLSHLNEEELAERQVLISHLRHFQAAGATPPQAATRAIREAAFTHLNRLCAYKMLERRRVIREAVSRGIDSTGFKFYLADHPEKELLWASGQQDHAYRHFLRWLAESLSDQINVLFSSNEIANYLLPQHNAVEAVLELINQPELDDVWDEDETIGWIYQYFTPDESRRQARKESSAPRDSYELAFLNQFYTPRYIVEFLVENTLGRLWYDMMQGDTVFTESCLCLAYNDGEWEDIPKKDPREIRIMDPACGSGHFLLYCFDLMLQIYEEAYTDPKLGPALARDYPTLDSLRAAAPALILEKNLYGIDIDPRATQIAALALWLRAQRAFTEAEIPAATRAPITKANIVCAEPMPGEKDMLEEFLQDLEPPALRPLVREVFERMKLAGEAGSLLRIEEEIHDVVEEARQRWGRLSRHHQLSLFTEGRRAATRQQLELDLLALTIDEFWEEAEANIIESLRIYAKQNGCNDGPFVRHLFSEDAGRGFAFVDVCRKQYDVVLMNPPFGQPATPSKAYITKSYPISKHDVACAFVDRWLGKCTPVGRLGAITTRTPFFLSTSTAWRKEVVLQNGRLRVFADLGFGVLDAMVETAAYVLQACGSDESTLFVRALKEEGEDKALAISQALSSTDDPRRFVVDSDSFELVPNSPLCYWVSDSVRSLFQELLPFEGEGRTVKVGLSTANDFRFVRLWTEVSPEKIGTKWFPFAKGGAYSPYYADLHLVVNWENDGKEIRAFPRSGIRNTQFYFRPGLTWPLRAARFGPSILPSGSIFSARGYAIIADPNSSLKLLGLGNSLAFDFLFKTMLGRYEYPEFIVGVLKKLPLSRLSSDQVLMLSEAANSIFSMKKKVRSGHEVEHWFSMPSFLHMEGNRLKERIYRWCRKVQSTSVQIEAQQSLVDSIGFAGYGFSDRDINEVIDLSSRGPTCIGDQVDESDDNNDSLVGAIVEVSEARLTNALISYTLGVAFGRWDVRLATGQRPIPPLPDDPFAPLPRYSPGMLTDRAILDGEVGPSEYPVAISTNGILVDDPESPDDIVHKVREVFEAIWGERADEIESEACEILGVEGLGEYFRNPRQFFDYHIKQYSMSRRKAPIYWLLQSPRRSYGLWIYYHCLDKDTLFKVLAMYIEPKIRLEQTRLDEMRVERIAAGTGGSEVKRLERAIDQHETMMSDLHAFRDQLSRAAELYLDPDLDDGVVLNMAPLWELVPWNEPKKYWERLLRGDYEWSSIAKQLGQRG